jgi:hypothetical protein
MELMGDQAPAVIDVEIDPDEFSRHCGTAKPKYSQEVRYTRDLLDALVDEKGRRMPH